ncbi:type III secretion system chaperone [Achromobacter deleyi]|uniref:type III secretion system chaperone n=1 Tax=Achromobacter deleyi TaxID=1353891 RepID=UPI00146571C4|nr:type III secretion system chaperone [Achromobacter deleyi]CAB3881064.1 hypothetical protein LMG3412_03258 [Achromobacter deleyi]
MPRSNHDDCLKEYAQASPEPVQWDADGSALCRPAGWPVHAAYVERSDSMLFFSALGRAPSRPPAHFWRTLLTLGYPCPEWIPAVSHEPATDQWVLSLRLPAHRYEAARFAQWLAHFGAIAADGAAALQAPEAPPWRPGVAATATPRADVDLTPYQQAIDALADRHGAERLHEWAPQRLLLRLDDLDIQLRHGAWTDTLMAICRIGGDVAAFDRIGGDLATVNARMPTSGPHFSIEALSGELILAGTFDLNRLLSRDWLDYLDGFHRHALRARDALSQSAEPADRALPPGSFLFV